MRGRGGGGTYRNEINVFNVYNVLLNSYSASSKTKTARPQRVKVYYASALPISHALYFCPHPPTRKKFRLRGSKKRQNIDVRLKEQNNRMS